MPDGTRRGSVLPALELRCPRGPAGAGRSGPCGSGLRSARAPGGAGGDPRGPLHLDHAFEIRHRVPGEDDLGKIFRYAYEGKSIDF